MESGSHALPERQKSKTILQGYKTILQYKDGKNVLS